MSHNMILLRFQVQYMVYLSHLVLVLPFLLPIDLIIPEDKILLLVHNLLLIQSVPNPIKHGLQNKNWEFWSQIWNQLEAIYVAYVRSLLVTTYFCN